jgi:hypothetical protein
MTGITKHMKDKGYVVTLVPMSTSLYSGEEDTSEKQVMRNEYAKYRMQPYKGGKAIVSGSTQQFDLLEMADSVLLQWYSGFDASLCENSDDPNRCKCDNIEVDGYPNVLDVKTDGMFSAFYDTDKGDGNMFPSTYPVRCQACGKNVTLKDGTYGEFPCHADGEDWFVAGGNDSATAKAHNDGLVNYSKTHNNSVPYYWTRGVEVSSKCPRGIDCPDWRYKDEKPYARQLKLLTSLAKVMDLSKVAIGFETLGTDVLVQMAAYADKTLMWDTVNWLEDKEHRYHLGCTKNLTDADIASGALTGAKLERCTQPLLTQQWGLKFNASEMVALDAAVKDATGKGLAGIGVYTLDGILATDPTVAANRTDISTWPRMWFDELVKLNKTYQIPLNCGDRCFHKK